MVLDINLFRSSDTLQLVKESQRKRSCDKLNPTLIDEIVEYDSQWREALFLRSKYSQIENNIKKVIGQQQKKSKNSNSEITNTITLDISDTIINKLPEIDIKILETFTMEQLIKLNSICSTKKKELQDVETESVDIRDAKIRLVGNIVHDSVPISSNEDDNMIVCSVGDIYQKKYSHVDLINKINGVNTDAGTRIAGNRGYFLKGPCVFLAQALQHLSLKILDEKGYEILQTPFFMNEDIMKDVAQLSQFDEELYKVQSDENTKYLIATSEQPITALHYKETLGDKILPIKYGGISTCFRKETGRHGRDTSGIFRVHQFEKVEQFILCSPENNESWSHLENMLETSKYLLDQLKIPYRVVNIVSGELNLAASKKYDIEGWFAGSGTFRELVSCSNCTDYHSRNLGIKYGGYKNSNKETKYVHMLNATMCAVTRMICVILENYQTDDGIIVPDILQEYMPTKYKNFIPYVL